MDNNFRVNPSNQQRVSYRTSRLVTMLSASQKVFSSNKGHPFQRAYNPKVS